MTRDHLLKQMLQIFLWLGPLALQLDKSYKTPEHFVKGCFFFFNEVWLLYLK